METTWLGPCFAAVHAYRIQLLLLYISFIVSHYVSYSITFIDYITHNIPVLFMIDYYQWVRKRADVSQKSIKYGI